MTRFFDEAIVDDRQTRAGARMRHVMLGVVFLATLAVMAYVFQTIDHELELATTIDSDNVTWTMSQTEVDALKFQRALLAAADTPDARHLDELRLAFDIFYSRFSIIARSDQLAILPINNELHDSLWSEAGFFARVTPLIDGDDATLAAALPQIVPDVEKVVAEVRHHVVNSLQFLTDLGDTRREELRRSLQVFTAAALGLLGMMTALSAVIVFQNRAQQRKSETTVRAVHNLRATIESALDAVVITDAAGRITDCNRAAEALFRLDRFALHGRAIGELVSGGPGTPFRDLPALVRQTAATEGTDDGRLRMAVHRDDGPDVPIEIALAGALGAGGTPMFIAFLRDISERIDRERSLQSARNDALKGEEAKSRFLAVMSHEMRTPLNGLIAATELMQSSTELDQRQAWLSEIVLSCGLAALDQVNNVLELTRLGSDQTGSYAAVAFSPVAVVRDLMLQNQPQATRRGNALSFDEPSHPLPMVLAPRQLFLRVLYNLIGNAVKFTDGGRVTVTLQADPVDDGRRVHLRVSVIDTGIGIAEADLERIFHNFETLDASYARMREGTGLGLGIAKLSAEAMGGTITVQSELGKGSTFTLDVTLPVAAQAETTADPAPKEAAQTRALQILVAEDNPINSLLLAEMLRLRGPSVTTAADGIAAVEAARGTLFDLILMDISMPRMDGLEATRLIRRDPVSRNVPVIGVTANASPDKVPEFLAAGLNDVLVKPVTRNTLITTIAAHVAGMPPQAITLRTDANGECPILNVEVFSETLQEMGRDFLERLADRLLSEVEAVIIQLRDLTTAGALTDAARAAHKTAGAAAAIGLSGLHSTLSAFEKCALDGNAASARTALDEVRRLLPLTVVTLRHRGLSVAHDTA